MSLDWRGDDVKRNTMQAVEKGINQTLIDCVSHSKAIVPVKTTILQGSIQMRPAHDEGGQLVGEFGSYNNNYAVHVEFGTAPHIIESHGPYSLHNAETGQYFGKKVHHPGSRARPFLRPSADWHFPELAENIKARMPW
jgi:hypothetical protein